MRLRLTILLLAGVTLLCAAQKPQPNTENQQDARKLRYAQRQKLTNPGAKAETPETSDPNAPLSLLPAGADTSTEDAPNQPPQTGELKDGITATGSVDAPAPAAGTSAAGVRSLALDGSAYGEEKKVVQQPALISAPTKQVVASNMPLPTLRGSQPAGANARPALQTQATANAKQLASAAKPPAINKATTASAARQLATTATPKPRTTKPVEIASKPVVASKPAPVAAKPSASELAKMPATGLPDKRLLAQLPDKRGATQGEEVVKTAPTEADAATADDSGDRIAWLDKKLADNPQQTQVNTDDLRLGSAAGKADTTLNTEGGEYLANPGQSDVNEAEIAPLGIPGQGGGSPRGRMGYWLLGFAGLLGAGGLLVAVPKPRKRAGEDGLELIETIGLADDRELVILRRKHYALVLGKTRAATHLLEKVSVASLDADYGSVINTIIKRESENPELWRMRPLFNSSYRVEHAPEERSAPARQTSLAELRASLQVVGPSRASSVSTPTRATMSELRERGGVTIEAPQKSTATRVTSGSLSRESVIRQLREQARQAS